MKSPKAKAISRDSPAKMPQTSNTASWRSNGLSAASCSFRGRWRKSHKKRPNGRRSTTRKKYINSMWAYIKVRDTNLPKIPSHGALYPLKITFFHRYMPTHVLPWVSWCSWRSSVIARLKCTVHRPCRAHWEILWRQCKIVVCALVLTSRVKEHR